MSTSSIVQLHNGELKELSVLSLSSSAPITISKEPASTTAANLDDSNSNEIDFDDDGSDDHNNNYIPDQSGDESDTGNYSDNAAHSSEDDDDDDENDYYTNDPEYFEYESYPIEKIDWIVERKCEAVMSHLKLDDPFDVLALLRHFKWNHQALVTAYNKDRKSFASTYLLYSDDNNNNNSGNRSKVNVSDRIRLLSYVNIFGGCSSTSQSIYSKIQASLNKSSNSERVVGPRADKDELFCSICCSTQIDELVALDECGAHFFCTDCWSLHFEANIKQGAACLFECMQTKCSALASKEFVLKCLQASNSIGNSLPKKQLSDRYRKLIGKHHHYTG
jgi:hypothetical protein